MELGAAGKVHLGGQARGALGAGCPLPGQWELRLVSPQLIAGRNWPSSPSLQKKENPWFTLIKLIT